MKVFTSISIISICLIVVVACQRKAAPVITNRTVEPPPPAKVEPVFASKEIEAGQVIYTTKCVRCHDAKPVQRWNVEEWKPILRSMIRKSKLDSTESSNVTLYVNYHAKKP